MIVKLKFVSNKNNSKLDEGNVTKMKNDNNIDDIINLDKLFKDINNKGSMKGYRDIAKDFNHKNDNITEDKDINSIISAEVTDTGINVFYHTKGNKNWLASFDYDSIGNAINIDCLNPNEKATNFKGTLLMNDKAKKIYEYQNMLKELKLKKREVSEELSNIDDIIMETINNINKLVNE